MNNRREHHSGNRGNTKLPTAVLISRHRDGEKCACYSLSGIQPREKFGSSPREHGNLAIGYTLVEILVVMAIFISMLGLLVPALKSTRTAAALNVGGNQVATLLAFARENSLSKNVMTALAIVTDPAINQENSIFTVVELLPPANGASLNAADWRQISKWQKLEDGIVVSNWTTQSGSSGNISVFPSLVYGNKQIDPANVKVLIFMPDGGTCADSPTTMQLSEAKTLKNGIPANYYNLTVLNATGRIKICRP